MSEMNRVKVRIYGQEYTITGDKARDQIVKVADHVDEVMRSISESLGGGAVSPVAVLAAVNIADELLALKDAQSEDEQEKEQLRKDIAHYMQLWDEAKKNFLQFKEDAQQQVGQKDKLQDRLNEKAIENDNLIRQAAEKEKKIEELETRVNNLAQRLKSREEGQANSSEQIRELEDKYKELEGNYFELQMENIQLKGELERYKRTTE
ncbi:MAG: cell division protein ZapA [Clostridiales Family XIII bacterium]|jgi:cell division protein ZapA|nr:cell division protein ZapA [Clostridiales Family XIII bacterium]